MNIRLTIIMAKNLTSPSSTSDEASSGSSNIPLPKNVNLDLLKSHGLHFGVPTIWLLLRLFILTGALIPFEGVALLVIYGALLFRSEAPKGMKALTKRFIMPFLGVSLFLPGVFTTPANFVYEGRTGEVQPQDLGLPKTGDEQEQTITRGESQGADNASWSHNFGPEALSAFISPLEGQDEGYIEARTVTFPGQGLVTVRVEGVYTYNSTDGMMTIDPAGGVVTLHGAKSQNPPTNNHNRFPAPQFNWGEILYRPAGQLPWNEGWQPVGKGVELEAGKGYEFTLNVNQSNLEWFSIQNLTLYVP